MLGHTHCFDNYPMYFTEPSRSFSVRVSSTSRMPSTTSHLQTSLCGSSSGHPCMPTAHTTVLIITREAPSQASSTSVLRAEVAVRSVVFFFRMFRLYAPCSALEVADIEFFDPRGPLPPFGKSLRIAPKEGDLILFPGWLAHLVHPTLTSQPRVSISFNLQGEWELASDVNLGYIL